MDDSLLRRLRAEQARALLYDAEPHHAVMLACDLLVAGVNGDAVVALAAESARTLPAHDANRRLARTGAWRQSPPNSASQNQTWRLRWS